MDCQNTIAGEALISGIALHTGVRANLRILPAPANSGILFRRVDMPGKPEVRPVAGNVIDVRRATTIASRETGAFVVTIEHIMSSLHAAQIDNAVVEMDGPEPPIADGSAKSFFDGIIKAGIQPQDAPAKYWSASAPIEFQDRDTVLKLEPCDHFEVSYQIGFGHEAMSNQEYSLAVTRDSFAKELSDARTFCIYEELAQLIAAGLVKGGSLECAVVMHNGAIISKEGLRHPDEFVRHKIMDLVGDIYLVGSRVRAKVTAIKAGHPTHVKLAQLMLAQSTPK